MAEPIVWTFFDGSFMKLDVLNQGGFVAFRSGISLFPHQTLPLRERSYHVRM
jgi:hypothetical protein